MNLFARNLFAPQTCCRLSLSTLALLLTVSVGAETSPNLDIVERAIAYHGGDVYRASQTELDLCSKSGCFHLVVKVDGGHFDYRVSRETAESTIEVRSTNDTLEVVRDGAKVDVEAAKNQVYRDWAMARVYFCFLPFRLDDPSVIQQDLGLVDWDGRKLHKVKVTFEAESSTDASDEFMYWFDPDTARLELFAYSYEVGGGGLRFRRAIKHRRIGGLLLFDQENLGTEDADVSVDDLDATFVRDRLRQISSISLKDIQVTAVNTSSASP